jgi:23S rRNA (adenine2503-C2)-methyltransferase
MGRGEKKQALTPFSMIWRRAGDEAKETNRNNILPMTSSKNPNLKNLSLSALAKAVTDLGEPAFRAKQVTKWLYQKRVAGFDAMANISKESRKKLAEHFTLEKLSVAAVLESGDKDAVKFGFEVADSEFLLESVLLIDGERRTACLSSQLGCGLGCLFCETGAIGLVRNLTQAEILGQLIAINDYQASRDDKLVTNIVFMGMGEALSNYDNFLSSLEIINSEDAFTIGSRRITVSTAGVVPSIRKLMEQDMPIGVAISLNAYTNEMRSRIMPVNKKYPIEALVQIAGEYFEKTGRPVTFEYVAIEGENDGKEAVSALSSLLGKITCKVNVISLNPSRYKDKKGLSQKGIQAFVQSLFDNGLNATLRKSRGQDIMGACGQLSGSMKVK